MNRVKGKILIEQPGWLHFDGLPDPDNTPPRPVLQAEAASATAGAAGGAAGAQRRQHAGGGDGGGGRHGPRLLPAGASSA